MKISLKWLNDYVDVSDFFQKPEALGEILTRAGLEVEELNSRAKDYQNVVTGLILTKDKHPNADKLSLCQVMTAEGVVHQIVCGAQNHKANDKVVVALPGAVLPGNFAIKKALVRGVESGGMLCSNEELGLPKGADGIVILPPDAPLGKGFAEYSGFDDVSFELKVTPNRADCLSHRGLAREVSCLLARPLKSAEARLSLSAESTKEKIRIDVLDFEACPRYCGRYLRGVRVGPSPEWLIKRLEVVGLNTINNVVDATNYVMMESGQPLHAFDADQIKGQLLRVQRASVGQIFTSLDGTQMTMQGEELLIADGDRPVALAGVVGGKNSGVSSETNCIFLEAAYFDPAVVRKSARLHGLQTDSAYRFSRGVDPDGTLRALDRVTALILEVAGGEALDQAWDLYPRPVKKKPIEVHLAVVAQRLGYEVDASLFESFVDRLGCQIEKLSEGSYRILPPAYRFDLEMEVDFIEEYARLNGYEHIPESLPAMDDKPTAHDLNYRLRNKLSRLVRGLGYNEALNLAFVGEKSERAFLKGIEPYIKAGLKLSADPIRLVNPLSDDQNVMRSGLSFSLWQNCLSNYHQGNQVGRLFEIGKSFERKEDGSFVEHWRLGMIAWGSYTDLWNHAPEHALVLELRSGVAQVLQSFGVSRFQFQTPSDRGLTPGILHRGQWAVIEKEGSALGFLGTAHPELVNEEKIRTQVALLEIDLDPLFVGQPRACRYSNFSRFQKVERDLALVMPKALSAGLIQAEIKKSVGELCQSVQIFDQYIGERVPAGTKSVAYRICFQDANGTLQDEPINKAMQQVLASLQQKWGISPR